MVKSRLMASRVLPLTLFDNEGQFIFWNIRRGASATTRINRKDFGLTWNKVIESGGVMVGDEVQIVLEVEMIKER